MTPRKPVPGGKNAAQRKATAWRISRALIEPCGCGGCGCDNLALATDFVMIGWVRDDIKRIRAAVAKIIEKELER